MAKSEEKTTKNSTRFERSESRTNYLWEHAPKISAHGMMEMLLMSYAFMRNWTTMYIGESGAGKNAIPECVAKQLGIDFICMNAVNKEPTELAMPYIIDKKYSFQIMEQLKPAFQPGWKGILHIEEYPQAEMQMRRVLYSLIYERRLDEHRLSDGCMIILSGNPPSNSMYNLADLDLPIEDRIGIMPIETKAIDWLKWARKEELTFTKSIDTIREKITDRCTSMNTDDRAIHSLIISLVEEDPAMFYEVYGRRLHHFSDAVHAIEQYFGEPFAKCVKAPEQKQFVQYVLTSITNPDFATRFIQFVLDRSSISGVEILLGSDEHFARMKKSLATIAKTISLNSINTEIIDAVINHDSVLVLTGDDGTTTPAPIDMVVRNYNRYLGLLLKHEPDTAVALLYDMIPKAENAWSDFNRTWDKESMTPESRWIVEKICDLQGTREAFEAFMKTDTETPAAADQKKGSKKKKAAADKSEATA